MKKSSRIVLAAVIFALLVFAAGAVLMLAKGHNDAQAREKTVFAMDTACTAKTWGADPAKISDEIARLDSVFDSHNEKSEISQLNRSGSGKLSEDMKTFLEQSVSLTEKYPDADISVGAVTKLWNVTGKDPKVPRDEDIAIALKTCGYENITLEGSSCTLRNGAHGKEGAEKGRRAVRSRDNGLVKPSVRQKARRQGFQRCRKRPRKPRRNAFEIQLRRVLCIDIGRL